MNAKKIANFLMAAVLSVGIAASIGQARAKTSQSTQVKPRTQTFTGEVSRSPDDRERQTPYILYDQTRQMNYFLDDNGNNGALARYNDHEIQVTGTLDRAGDTIHVQSIQSPSGEAAPFSSTGK
jgi:hypothetical protein